MMAFMPHRDVIVAFRVKFTKIVPHKICCASLLEARRQHFLTPW